MLPGMPRGLLAYQLNAKRDSVDGGGWGGAGRAQGSMSEANSESSVEDGV